MSRTTDFQLAETEIVIFAHGDISNPKNWSVRKKQWCLSIICILCFGATIGSSLYKYGIGPTVSSLGLTLFVLGFACGPLICPLSEMYGRRLVFVLVWPFIAIFTVPTAWVDSVVVIIVFRLFTGLAAGMVLTNGPAAIADIYAEIDLQGQGIAVSYFVLSAFTSPVIGPIIGFFIAKHLPTELWTIRVHFFMIIVLYPLVFLIPETHGPTILAKRAHELRQSGHTNAYTYYELRQKTMTAGRLAAEALGRPMKMLLTEPIVQGCALWTALSYGILYFSFESYPVIFIEQHNIPFQLAGLPFIPVMIGMIAAVISYVQATNFFIKLKFPKWIGNVAPDTPEARLKLALVGCLCLPASSFWLAWTSGPESHWVAPALSGILFGFSNMILFFTFSTYTGHCYSIYTGTASAATIFTRSVFGAIFPHSLLEKLGTKWGVSLFGFIAFGLTPIPIIYLRYGPRLREKSPYIQEALALVKQMHAEKPREADDETEKDSENAEREKTNEASESSSILEKQKDFGERMV